MKTKVHTISNHWTTSPERSFVPTRRRP